MARSRADKGQKVPRTEYNEGTSVVPACGPLTLSFLWYRQSNSEKKQNPTKFPLPERSSSLSFSLHSSFPPFCQFLSLHTQSQWVLFQTAALSFSPPSLSVRVTPTRLRELYPLKKTLIFALGVLHEVYIDSNCQCINSPIVTRFPMPSSMPALLRTPSPRSLARLPPRPVR